jgi:S-adenosylmethionine:tRNA ribosyltransferase-isomerase
LIATEPKRPSRVLHWEAGRTTEISLQELLDIIPAGDVLVLNDTKVLKRRVFAGDVEILFLSGGPQTWEVLFPSAKMKVGDSLELPMGIKMTLSEKGRPQKVTVDKPLTEAYFEQVAELPLPPYIQKARGERHNVTDDTSWYQTAWAENPGSFAAPTASLHFSSEDIEKLKSRGVKVVSLTLHVGLGTFLPVSKQNLDEHKMHEEYVEISKDTWATVQAAPHVWALGTTVTRALESAALRKLHEKNGIFTGFTDLLIQPGFKWKVVDRLLTNFHQPESTLLALVAGFAGLENVFQAYKIAIEKRFRLFSYGDLSLWIR